MEIPVCRRRRLVKCPSNILRKRSEFPTISNGGNAKNRDDHASVIQVVATLLLLQVAVGPFLSLFWRRSGNLMVPGFVHATVDSVRNALGIGFWRRLVNKGLRT